MVTVPPLSMDKIPSVFLNCLDELSDFHLHMVLNFVLLFIWLVSDDLVPSIGGQNLSDNWCAVPAERGAQSGVQLPEGTVRVPPLSTLSLA